MPAAAAQTPTPPRQLRRRHADAELPPKAAAAAAAKAAASSSLKAAKSAGAAAKKAVAALSSPVHGRGQKRPPSPALSDAATPRGRAQPAAGRTSAPASPAQPAAQAKKQRRITEAPPAKGTSLLGALKEMVAAHVTGVPRQGQIVVAKDQHAIVRAVPRRSVDWEEVRGLDLMQVPLTKMAGRSRPAITEDACRRSGRQRMAPLQAWRNERLVYERTAGSKLPSVRGVVLNAAGSKNGRNAA